MSLRETMVEHLFSHSRIGKIDKKNEAKKFTDGMFAKYT